MALSRRIRIPSVLPPPSTLLNPQNINTNSVGTVIKLKDFIITTPTPPSTFSHNLFGKNRHEHKVCSIEEDRRRRHAHELHESLSSSSVLKQHSLLHLPSTSTRHKKFEEVLSSTSSRLVSNNNERAIVSLLSPFLNTTALTRVPVRLKVRPIMEAGGGTGPQAFMSTKAPTDESQSQQHPQSPKKRMSSFVGAKAVPIKDNNNTPVDTSTTSVLGVVTPVRSVSLAASAQKVTEIGIGKMENEASAQLLTKDEREEFMSLFSQLAKDLTEIAEYRDMPDTNRWLSRVLFYNVPHGKRNRGLATALAYRYLAKELTEENMRLSYVLGWCVEILQAYFLVADDIMDDSPTRRGRPCWYKVDNLGTAAFNDALLLESSIYILLKKYFRDKPYYAELMDIMHDVNHKTVYGQSLDTRTGMEKKMESYTMDLYTSIVKYKTSFYSFYLPVRLALAMSGVNDPEVLQQVRTVTLEMGHFFQVQDDYLDCFGDVNVTGKVGTDIQDCKCSWLFVIAVQQCSPEQKLKLFENYGQHGAEQVETVKKLYSDLKLQETYNHYEEQTYNLICTHIGQMSDKLPKQLFYDMVNKIYRRSG